MHKNKKGERIKKKSKHFTHVHRRVFDDYNRQGEGVRLTLTAKIDLLDQD